jgi:hypothetical protein
LICSLIASWKEALATLGALGALAVFGRRALAAFASSLIWALSDFFYSFLSSLASRLKALIYSLIDCFWISNSPLT